MKISDTAHDDDITITITITVSDTFLEERAGRPLTDGELNQIRQSLGGNALHEVMALRSMHLTGESLHDLFNPEEAAIPTLIESLTDDQIAKMRGEQTDDWVGPDLDGRDGQQN